MPEWVDIGRVEDIPCLGARVAMTAKGPVAIFRNAADEIFALRDRCPHKDGPLSQGIVHGRRVTCPLHNWMVELSSGQAVLPDEGCTDRYSTKVEGGKIMISFSSNP